MPGFKTGNEYAGLLARDFYEKIPKSVLAAIAISFASQIDGDKVLSGGAQQKLLKEWSALHANGIVPQKPKR